MIVAGIMEPIRHKPVTPSLARHDLGAARR